MQNEAKNNYSIVDLSAEPSCCLCLLRGGALKQTDDRQKWAHIACALLVSGVVFKAPETHASIQVPSQLFKKEKKLKQCCIYCDEFSRFQTSMPNGLTVKCSKQECTNRFHVTCGYNHGKCLYEQADWPAIVHIYCHEHFKTKLEENSENVSRRNLFSINQLFSWVIHKLKTIAWIFRSIKIYLFFIKSL